MSHGDGAKKKKILFYPQRKDYHSRDQKNKTFRREREKLIFIRSSRVATLATDRELLRENLDRRQEGETLSC